MTLEDVDSFTAGQRSVLGYFAAGFRSCKMSERKCGDGEADVECPRKQHKTIVVWLQRVRIECMFYNVLHRFTMFYPQFHNVCCVNKVIKIQLTEV